MRLRTLPLFFLLFFCVACGPKTQMRMHGNIKSDKNIEVVYHKSDEQNRYERAVEKTRETGVKLLELPFYLITLPFGHSFYGDLKDIAKGMIKRRKNEED